MTLNLLLKRKSAEFTQELNGIQYFSSSINDSWARDFVSAQNRVISQGKRVYDNWTVNCTLYQCQIPTEYGYGKPRKSQLSHQQRQTGQTEFMFQYKVCMCE